MKHSDRFVRLVESAKEHITEVSPEQTLARLESGDDALLIDVREESEWEKGHIKGAIHIGKGILERDIEQQSPDPNREIILYCGGGYRSALAADNLQKMGYTNVASMSGGWRKWNELGYPVEE